MALIISPKILLKLRDKHNVNESEVIECFSNIEKGHLKDTREDHKTDPPTLWFVAETDMGRLLKVVFMQDPDTNDMIIKTAYSANPQEIHIYNKHA
jgi:hypothetical protein